MWNYSLKDHKDEIITHIIKCTMWLPIASLLALVGAIIKAVIDAYNNNVTIENSVVIFAVIACIISVISIIFNILYKISINKNPNNFNNDQLNYITPISNFRINSIVCELFFKDRINITSSLHYEMTANEDNVEYFEKELTWSGKKYYGTKLKNSNGNYELELFDSNDSIHKYKVKFHDQIKCQDKVIFDLETEVSDDELSMLPINSYMVKHQIDELTIRVVVPENYIKNVKKAIYLDIYRQMPIGESTPIKRKIIAGKECYEIIVQNPTISHRYFIEWEFTK